MALFYRQNRALTEGSGVEEEEDSGWYVSKSEVALDKVMLGVVNIV